MKAVEVRFEVRRQWLWWKWKQRKRLHLQCPENFNEMSLSQLMAYIKWVYLCRKILFAADKKGGLQILNTDLYNFTCLKMLKILLGIPSAVFLELQNTEQNCQVYDLLRQGLVDFVFYSKMDLVRNHLPYFWASATKFYGPGDELQELVLMEFALADTHYTNFVITGDELHLDKLIACLYRPGKSKLEIKQPNWDGDRRQRFNPYQVDDTVKQIHRLSPKKKILILLYFAGCRGNMESRYPDLFSKKSSGSSGGGWTEFIIAAAGGKFGDTDKTAYANVHTLFKAMDMLAVAAARQPES